MQFSNAAAFTASGGEKRLTFQGSENVAPDRGPDGRIAYVSKQGGRYHIWTVNPAAGKHDQLTSGDFDDEDPSWAPDARHIVFTRTGGYRSQVYILDTRGDPPTRLTNLEGDWYSPAWSPK